MDRARFILLVRRALRQIPPPFRDHLKQVDIVVKSRPSDADLRRAGIELEDDEALYGLYVGVPLTERDSGYNMALPDVIHIYQDELEQDFPDEDELVEEIRTTVLHEVAHHFGIDDDRLDELGMG